MRGIALAGMQTLGMHVDGRATVAVGGDLQVGTNRFDVMTDAQKLDSMAVSIVRQMVYDFSGASRRGVPRSAVTLLERTMNVTGHPHPLWLLHDLSAQLESIGWHGELRLEGDCPGLVFRKEL